MALRLTGLNAKYMNQEMHMKKYDVTALGELLIDFTENGKSSQGNPLFEANPGGAPCNVLAMLAKLGHKTAFIGKVGNDFFGEQLRTAIKEAGIDDTGLCTDEKIHTTLAMVHTYPDGDRDFSFYRNPGADMMLNKAEIREDILKDTKIFHFGTLSMTHEGVREATKAAIHIAEEAGAVISFDPNLRPPLWESLDEAREQVLYGLGHCQILKISDNEIQWLTGEEDYTAGVNWILERYQIPLILVSMGKEGSRAYYNEMMVEVKPFLQENTIETTGAGDTFCGCVLHYVCEHGINGLKEENLAEMLTFANAAASIITTRKGALRVMPEEKEIKLLI
jgi:fructokinase